MLADERKPAQFDQSQPAGPIGHPGPRPPAANRRGEAVQVYKQLCRSLQTELGVTPDKATTRLYQQLVKA